MNTTNTTTGEGNAPRDTITEVSPATFDVIALLNLIKAGKRNPIVVDALVDEAIRLMKA